MPTPFISPIPDAWLKDSQTEEFMRALLLTLNELLSPEGSIAVSEATTEVVLTQQEKLDLMTVTQDVNLDTMDDSIATIQSSSPTYTITNDTTDRTFNANAAAGSISASPSQSEVENLRDAQLASDDVLATVIRDLVNKDVFGD